MTYTDIAMIKACAAFLAVVALQQVPAASAHPPAPGSEDYAVMQPYKEWIESQWRHDGVITAWCCNLADGRPVAARIKNDHWQIYATPEKFEGITAAGWIDVPPDRVLAGYNPVGVPIAWVNRNGVLCFHPGNGT